MRRSEENASKPRIALVGPVYPFRGGISHYTSHLANHLIDEGYLVRVFSFRRQYPAFMYPGETDRDPSLQLVACEALYILDPLYPWTWWKCVREIERYKPNLAILPWWTTFWGPAFAYLLSSLRRKGIRTAVLIHNVVPHEARVWDRWISQFALRRTNFFIAQTMEQKERLIQIHPSADVKVSPHPIYDQFPGQRIDSYQAREKLKLPMDHKILLFFGIVRPYKGLMQLLDTVAVLRDRKFPVTLVVVGEFWEPLEQYTQKIQALGLGEEVRLIPGYAPNEILPLYFSSADLFVAPYIGGTQSGAVKLAMGFGLPVLISRQISDEILDQLAGQGVTISTPEDPQRFADDVQASLDSQRSNYLDSKAVNGSWSNLIQKIIGFAMPQNND
jgi:glycosyltransferase involved in cell wall biosynthesis